MSAAAQSPPPASAPPPVPSPADPPDMVRRWGPTMTLLVAILATATWLGLSPPWESRARADERAQAGSAALRTAQAECQQQLSTAVGAQTAQIRALDGRLVRLEAQQATQLYLLQLLAQRLQVPIPQGTALAPPPVAPQVP